MKHKILLLPDISNWAWGIKSKYIQKYLSDEFDVDVVHLDEGQKVPKDKDYSIYMTFTVSHLYHVRMFPINKLIGGATSHACYRRMVNTKDLRDRCAALHFNSMFLYKEALHNNNHDKNKIYYCPNGVDCNLFKPTYKKLGKDLVVGFVGKTNSTKGFNEYIKPAAESCSNTILKPCTASWKTARSIDKMPQYYNEIDVYICASINEGTPNPCLEAAACGKTIISTRVGNMPEFIDNGINGYLIDRKIDRIRDRINYFNRNRSKLIRMQEAARKTAEQWDWKIQAENYRKMFRDVIKNQK